MLCALCSVGGCENFFKPASFVPGYKYRSEASTAQTGVFQSNSNRRFAYMIPKGDGKSVYIFSEPPPDTSLQSTTDLALKIAAANGLDAEGKAVITQTVLDLTHRTQAVVILRDSLFRLAEAYSNGVITSVDYMKGFDSVIAAATTVAQADANRAQAAVNRSDTVRTLSAATTQPALLADPQALRRTLETIQSIQAGGDGTGPR